MRRRSPQARLLLSALLDRLSEWKYGYDLSKRTGIKSGTLYPLLIRLANQGLLQTDWREPDQAGRPPRHVYRLTAQGADVARTETESEPSRRIALRPARATS